jgi:hypothetical protein
MSIDNPNSSSGALIGRAPIGGWAVSTIAPIAGIYVSVDGTALGSASYGGTRSDVCAVYSSASGCPNVGWNFVLDTTLLADGPHTLQITAASAAGQSSSQTQLFRVANAGSDAVIVDIDSPTTGQAVTGIGGFYGWTLDTSGVPIQSVVVLVDGVQNGTATYGTTRPDVCAVYQNAAGCPYVGWSYTLDTTKISNGLHSLQVRTTAVDGTVSTNAQNFNVVNPQQ